MRHAEALLLVDDEQPDVAELHVARQQPVCPDDQVDLAGGEVGDHLLLLGLRAEPAHHLDADGEAGEAFLQRFLMLERQHRRRREEGHLLTVHDGLEGGAHRHLGLAVADIAAQQPIHRRG